jgi:hypothetical protein
MIIKMRIYRRHDLDLVGLFANDNFKFEEEVANALRAYVRKEDKKILIPTTHSFSKTVNPKSQINIVLDETIDRDVIDFLFSVPSGNRNSFIKSVFRNYINTPYFEAFTSEIKYTLNKKTDEEINRDADKAYSEIMAQKTTDGSNNILLDGADYILK